MCSNLSLNPGHTQSLSPIRQGVLEMWLIFRILLHNHQKCPKMSGAHRISALQVCWRYWVTNLSCTRQLWPHFTVLAKKSWGKVNFTQGKSGESSLSPRKVGGKLTLPEESELYPGKVNFTRGKCTFPPTT